MTLKRVALVAILAGVALVPVTAAFAAHHSAKIRLASVPLQSAQLGPTGASFALNYDSGAISSDGSMEINVGDGFYIGGFGFGGFGFGLDTTGLVGGYVLDYGDAYTGSAGVTEIRTSVAEYKNQGKAWKALASARYEERFLAEYLYSPTVPATEKKVTPVRVGQRRFGFLITQAAPNLNPIVRLDEQVTAGRFVLDLTVTAGSVSAAEDAAPQLLRELHRRLQLRLGGHGTDTQVPHAPKIQIGQAPGGPDLSTMILQPTDVGQSHAIGLFQGYSAAPPALSDFDMTLSPAGTYAGLDQQIGWWPTATEATYGEVYGAASPYNGFGIILAFAGHARSGGETVTPVDLSSIQDPATGYIITGGGQSEALVTVTNGQAGESIDATGKATLQASDVQSLAQAAANRLDAGLGP